MMVFIWVISILGGLLIIGFVTALCLISKRSTEREEAMRAKERQDKLNDIEKAKKRYCDGNCKLCGERQFCKVRD